MKRQRLSSRALFSALFALLLIAQSAVFLPRAEAKKAAKLAMEPGSYVRWRRGLPPEDGKWYRAMILTKTDLAQWRLFRGNNRQSVDGSSVWSIQGYSDIYGGDTVALTSTVSAATTGKLAAAETVIDRFPEIDYDREVFYTATFLNTPLLRYDSKGGPDGNGHNRFFGNAPYYQIRLSDWSEGDGVPQEQYLTYDPAAFQSYSFRVTGTPSSWYFCGYEHDDDVDRGKYVIGNLQKDDNSAKNVYLETVYFGDRRFDPPGEEDTVYYLGIAAQKRTWFNTEEFYVYYGDRVSVNAVKDGQTIENGQSMTLGKNGYLTLSSGSTLTVRDGGILCIDGVLFNDGTIRVEKGGTLIVRKNASIMPWDTNSGTGSVVCEGGDLIVYSGGRLVCNGSGGFRAANSTVHNFGLILTQSLDVQGLKNSFHNDGAVMAGYNVQSDRAQTFRDAALGIDANGMPASNVTDCMKALSCKNYRVGDGCVTGHRIYVC